MIGSLFLWKYLLDDPIFLTDNFFLLKNLFAVTWEPRGKASILSRTETMNTRKRFFALSPAEVSEEDPGCGWGWGFCPRGSRRCHELRQPAHGAARLPQQDPGADPGAGAGAGSLHAGSGSGSWLVPQRSWAAGPEVTSSSFPGDPRTHVLRKKVMASLGGEDGLGPLSPPSAPPPPPPPRPCPPLLRPSQSPPSGQEGGSGSGSYAQGFALRVYFHFCEPKTTWRKIPNDQSSLTWRVPLISSLNIILRVKPKCLILPPELLVSFSYPYSLFVEAQLTLTSKLATGAYTQNPADTLPFRMLTSHL